MTRSWLPRRDSLLERSGEAWKPPRFQAPSSLWARLAARARRCLDLQAASIWNDLRVLLPTCEGTLLDVGCGAQPYRPLLPQAVRYKAIDTADAESHFGYQVPDTTYFEGDCWPVADASVETILATETLEHVLNPTKFLSEARRCLAPEGRLILTVPFAARWHFIPHDYWRFTPSGLRHVLNDAGFHHVAVYARGNELTVLCYKATTLVLAWILGRSDQPLVSVLQKSVGVLCIPLLFLAALIGQLSLRCSRGGDDCLGYTVVASPHRIASGESRR